VGPDPAELLEEYDRSPGALELPDVVADPGSSVWTVDDDGEDCPNAQFTSIQDAVHSAGPEWCGCGRSRFPRPARLSFPRKRGAGLLIPALSFPRKRGGDVNT